MKSGSYFRPVPKSGSYSRPVPRRGEGNQELLLLRAQPSEGDDPLLVDLMGDVPDDAAVFRLLLLKRIGGVPGSGIVTSEVSAPGASLGSGTSAMRRIDAD